MKGKSPKHKVLPNVIYQSFSQPINLCNGDQLQLTFTADDYCSVKHFYISDKPLAGSVNFMGATERAEKEKYIKDLEQLLEDLIA